MGKVPHKISHDSASAVRREMREELEKKATEKSFDLSLCKDKPKGLKDRVISPSQ